MNMLLPVLFVLLIVAVIVGVSWLISKYLQYRGASHAVGGGFEPGQPVGMLEGVPIQSVGGTRNNTV